MALKRVLIANRGEIAVRIIHACEALGIETVLAYSEADRDTLGTRLATRAVCIGPAQSSQSYLHIPSLVAAALGTGCDALHPGYGFLAESEDLAQACADEHIVFIGPPPDQILQMGNKLQARALAKQNGVPMLPGSEKVATAADAEKIARQIGLPVMLKAAAGGGGRGMKIVSDFAELPRQFAAASHEARAAFGDDTLYLERYISNARHVEVQVLGDHHGHVIHLGERDCSLQRRHQKIMEEAPAPDITPRVRARIGERCIEACKRIAYRGAGTFEFLFENGEFFFIEMNTRVQVIRVAAGEKLKYRQRDIVIRGHAIECRINAEDPFNFTPSPGKITSYHPPGGPGIRVDSHAYHGYMVPPYYDSMIGKLIAYGDDRDQAIRRMRIALSEMVVEGIKTNLPLHRELLDDTRVIRGGVSIHYLERKLAQRAAERDAKS